MKWRIKSKIKYLQIIVIICVLFSACSPVKSTQQPPQALRTEIYLSGNQWVTTTITPGANQTKTSTSITTKSLSSPTQLKTITTKSLTPIIPIKTVATTTPNPTNTFISPAIPSYTLATTTITHITTSTIFDMIDASTGIYKSYYLGFVNTPEGNLSGSGCYDDTGNFIILINNKNATNPTYSQLTNFLKQNKTDKFPYTYKLNSLGMYYGTAKSHVDLQHIQDIIDGTIQPSNPNICADFAERLHNDAEMAGIKCAYVNIDLSGYTDPKHYGIPSNTSHALNAFQTTDRGLVYIDDTNSPGPTRCVKTINIEVGQSYIPISLFPEAGWESTWESMGTVTDILVVWDGKW